MSGGRGTEVGDPFGIVVLRIEGVSDDVSELAELERMSRLRAESLSGQIEQQTAQSPGVEDLVVPSPFQAMGMRLRRLKERRPEPVAGHELRTDQDVPVIELGQPVSESGERLETDPAGAKTIEDLLKIGLVVLVQIASESQRRKMGVLRVGCHWVAPLG